MVWLEEFRDDDQLATPVVRSTTLCTAAQLAPPPWPAKPAPPWAEDETAAVGGC